VPAAFLRFKKSLADFIPYVLGETGKVFFGITQPRDRFYDTG
jgi:hypothetical protein